MGPNSDEGMMQLQPKAFHHTRNLFRRILRKAYGRTRGGDIARAVWSTDVSDNGARANAVRALEAALHNGVINLRDYDRILKLHNLARDQAGLRAPIP